MSRSRIKRVSALKQEPIKTPGSPYAVLHGCTCSPLANNYGAGVVTRDGQITTTTFTISPDCPMHSITTNECFGSGEQLGH